MKSCKSYRFGRMVIRVASLVLTVSAASAFAGSISSDTLNDPNAMLYQKDGKGNYDGGTDTSLTNAARWAANSGSVITPQTMDDDPMNPNPAAANCLYVVKSGALRTYKDPHGKISTSGQPLFVGGKEWHVAGTLTEATSYGNMPTCFPPISFYDGSKMAVNTGIGLTNTAINVRSGTGNPFTIEAANQSCRFDYCSFKGTAASGVKFGNSGTDMSKGMTFYVKGSDFSDFKGKIILNASTAVRATTTLVIEEGGLSFPGALDVNVNAIVKARSADVCSVSTVTCQSNATLQVGTVGTWSIANLTMNDVATLSYQTISQAETPCITVTDSVTWPTGKKVKVDFSVASGLTRVPLLRFGPAVTTTMTKEMFKLTESDTLTYEVVSDELGQTLYANVMEVVSMVKTDDEPYALSPTGGVHWSNNEAVSGGKVYVVGKGMALNMNSTHQGQADYVFPGYQLKVEENAQVSFNGGLLSSEVTNRVVAAGADVQYLCYNGKIINLLGETFTIQSSGLIYFHCYQNGGFSVKVPITGAGTIVPRWRGKDLSNGFFEMPRDNSGFTGKTRIICQGSPGSADYTPFSTKCLTVRAYDQKNFGGPIPSGATAPVYDALTVRDNQVLKAVRNNENNGTVTFDEPSRGIYVPWRGRLAADSDATLAIKQQVTYAGRIQKIGNGTLALGGTAKFTGKQHDTPYDGDTFLAGTNELDIAEGALKPLNTDAFAGVAVIFSNATTLVINPTADETVKQYGLKATTPGSSVTVPSGKVNLSFENVANVTEDQTVAVATFATEEAADAFAEKLTLPKMRGVTVSLAVEANEADADLFTVFATLKPRGAMIFLK